MSGKKILFITGTDTGVGKTLLSALLLSYLRRDDGRALAMKPFCSGGLGDVRLLQSLQPGELSDAEMNPFYFAQPVAPLIAAEEERKSVTLREVIQRIKFVLRKCDQLLIEGSGGLLVPLGKGYYVMNLIAKLDCRVIVVARNKLGTINHTLLTVQALKANGIRAKDIIVALMGVRNPDASMRTNGRILSAFLKPIKVASIPYLGTRLLTKKSVEKNQKALAKTLNGLVFADA